MLRTFARCLAVSLAAVSIFAVGIGPAEAQSADAFRNSIELSLSPSYSSANGLDSEAFGLRYSRFFDERWGLQIAYQREDGAFFDDDEILEASAQLRFFENDRLQFFGYFGAGVLRYGLFNIDPAANTIPDLGDDEILSVHFGLGLDIDLGERLFLRPDVIFRRYEDILDIRDSHVTDATIAVGYRF